MSGRVERLKAGNRQFGHQGRHQGVGSRECPRALHHHHDEFCEQPTVPELLEAGIDPEQFRSGSRAG